jgi:hypothetical protein
VIFLSCTSVEILPNAFRPLITNERELKIIPLDQQLCEEFIHRELADIKIPQPYRQLLAEKSEGHPLYLRYLVKYVKNHHENLSLENLFQDIPVFGGDIEIYYERIWNSIREKNDEVWIVATIAALRNGVDRESFKTMLPDKTQYAFISVFQRWSICLRMTH